MAEGALGLEQRFCFRVDDRHRRDRIHPAPPAAVPAVVAFHPVVATPREKSGRAGMRGRGGPWKNPSRQKQNRECRRAFPERCQAGQFPFGPRSATR